MLKKPGKRKDAGKRQAAHGESQVRVGQAVPQAAEPPHVDHVAHRVHHAAGREEQQRLEERVGEQVEHAATTASWATSPTPAPSAMNM